MSLHKIDVGVDGSKVLFKIDDKVVEMPWNVAEDLYRAILIQTRKAETFAKANQIIFDQALLMRAGASVGLSNNPAVIKTAINEAAHNATLRRYMKPKFEGIQSQETFGTPRIVQ